MTVLTIIVHQTTVPREIHPHSVFTDGMHRERKPKERIFEHEDRRGMGVSELR